MLAHPRLNRFDKRDKDAAEWFPSMNQCWFSETVIAVKLKYGLTVDEVERESLDSLLTQRVTSVGPSPLGGSEENLESP